jgi:hypothetical protein
MYVHIELVDLHGNSNICSLVYSEQAGEAHEYILSDNFMTACGGCVCLSAAINLSGQY